MLGKRSRLQAENCGTNQNDQANSKVPSNSKDSSSDLTSTQSIIVVKAPLIQQVSKSSLDCSSSLEQPSQCPRKDLILEMLGYLIDEFNCNHQADLEDANGRVEIISRIKEQKAITQFINDNMPNKAQGKAGKAALMYLCGHPGTGKTSTLNYVLSGFVSGNIMASLQNQLCVQMYNAMTFSDFKSFCFQLLDDLSMKHTGQNYSEAYSKGLKKKELDEDEIANMVARMLAQTPNQTKILVIDEIDAFEAFENAFRTFTKAVLGSKTSTLIIGIANSVDLPFKKKHSAIAMRDTQLLFEPYGEEQIITIIEEKINMRFVKFPLKIKQSPIKSIFFNLLDQKAMEMIAKKVAKMNGDARVAFDIVKSSLVEVFNSVKYREEEKEIQAERQRDDELPSDDKIRITLDIVLKVFSDKYSSKLPQTLRCLPMQNLIVLEAIVNIYDENPYGEDRKISYLELQQEVELICRQRCLFDVIRGQGISGYMDVLSFYKIIEIDRPKNQKAFEAKVDPKKQLFYLKVEFQELKNELLKLIESQKEPKPDQTAA